MGQLHVYVYKGNLLVRVCRNIAIELLLCSPCTISLCCTRANSRGSLVGHHQPRVAGLMYAIGMGVGCTCMYIRHQERDPSLKQLCEMLLALIQNPLP